MQARAKTRQIDPNVNLLQSIFKSEVILNTIIFVIFSENYMQIKAMKEYKELTVIKKGEKEYLESVKKKYNLN